MPLYEYGHDDVGDVGDVGEVAIRAAHVMMMMTLMTMPATDRPMDALPRRRAPAGSDTDVLSATTASSYRPHTAQRSQRNAVTLAAAQTHIREAVQSVRKKKKKATLVLVLTCNKSTSYMIA